MQWYLTANMVFLEWIWYISCVTSVGDPALGIGLDDLQRSLATQSIPGFWDSGICVCFNTFWDHLVGK